MRYAGFWIRVLALIIDSVILGIVLLPLSLAMQFSLRSHLNPAHPDFGPLFAAYFTFAPIFMLLRGAYFTFFVGKFGATPGKMALKLRVVNPDGSPVGYAKACGRYFSLMVSFLCCYIGVLMVAWDPEKRGLHDRMCNTRVIQT